jgi:membrane protease subunit HflC
MSLLHGHTHQHTHDHHHDHAGQQHEPGKPRTAWAATSLRFVVAGLVVGVALLTACVALVEPGEAMVVTRFGDPVRVAVQPGLAWRLPAPLENTISVDLRLRTTSSGLQDVGTRDGLRVLVQAYVAWKVPGDAAQITQFLRAVRNQPDEAGEQLRSNLASALEITASSFELASLVNTDPHKVQLGAFEQRLRARLEQQILQLYGIAILQVGIERLTLPTEALTATIERMRAERQTVAAERMAQGERVATEIRSNADRDSRITIARANAEAAATEAKARGEAADIYQHAYAQNPALYALLRSLDTLETVVSENTRLILRTDAAPFRAFVEGPEPPDNAPPAAPK